MGQREGVKLQRLGVRFRHAPEVTQWYDADHANSQAHFGGRVLLVVLTAGGTLRIPFESMVTWEWQT